MKETSLDLNLREVGERLKKTRKALDLTQQEIAKMSDIPTSTVSEMEKGIKKPHTFYLYLLSTQFYVNINWILTGKGAMFLPSFELKWDFGQDNPVVMEMIYLIENDVRVRHKVLSYYTELPEIKRLLRKKDTSRKPSKPKKTVKSVKP